MPDDADHLGLERPSIPLKNLTTANPRDQAPPDYVAVNAVEVYY